MQTVIEDSYGNPAIVTGRAPNGNPVTITQLVGSDRGRRTHAPRRIIPVTDSRREWALSKAQELGVVPA